MGGLWGRDAEFGGVKGVLGGLWGRDAETGGLRAGYGEVRGSGSQNCGAGGGWGELWGRDLEIGVGMPKLGGSRGVMGRLWGRDPKTVGLGGVFIGFGVLYGATHELWGSQWGNQ